MKIVCFLIFFVIANVWTNETEHYKWDVAYTNALVHYAYGVNDRVIKGNKIANGLEHVIKTIVLKGDHDLDAMNRMFVLPECPYSNRQREVPVLFCFEKTEILQSDFQKAIKTELDITRIGHIDEELTAYTFKDFGDDRRRLTRIALRNIISQAIGGERKVPKIYESNIIKLLKKNMDWESSSFDEQFSTSNINETTKQNKPNAEDESNDTTKRDSVDLSVASAKDKSELIEDEDDDFAMIDYDELQDDEESATLLDDKSKLIEGEDDDYDHIEPVDEESVVTLIEQLDINESYFDQVGGQPSNKNPHHVKIKSLCQFIALFLSTKEQVLGLEALDDDDAKTCTVKIKTTVYQNKVKIFMYKQVDGIWCQELKNLIA